MALVLAVMQHFFYAHRYPQLLLNLLVGVAVYGAGALWFVLTREPMGMEMRRRMMGYFVQAEEQ
jgi:ABC-type Fe3+-siderophore transport system permease subunit